jgi:hypothetical protein
VNHYIISTREILLSHNTYHTMSQSLSMGPAKPKKTTISTSPLNPRVKRQVKTKTISNCDSNLPKSDVNSRPSSSTVKNNSTSLLPSITSCKSMGKGGVTAGDNKLLLRLDSSSSSLKESKYFSSTKKLLQKLSSFHELDVTHDETTINAQDRSDNPPNGETNTHEQKEEIIVSGESKSKRLFLKLASFTQSDQHNNDDKDKEDETNANPSHVLPDATPAPVKSNSRRLLRKLSSFAVTGSDRGVSSKRYDGANKQDQNVLKQKIYTTPKLKRRLSSFSRRQNGSSGENNAKPTEIPMSTTDKNTAKSKNNVTDFNSRGLLRQLSSCAGGSEGGSNEETRSNVATTKKDLKHTNIILVDVLSSLCLKDLNVKQGGDNSKNNITDEGEGNNSSEQKEANVMTKKQRSLSFLRRTKFIDNPTESLAAEMAEEKIEKGSCEDTELSTRIELRFTPPFTDEMPVVAKSSAVKTYKNDTSATSNTDSDCDSEEDFEYHIASLVRELEEQERIEIRQRQDRDRLKHEHGGGDNKRQQYSR